MNEKVLITLVGFFIFTAIVAPASAVEYVIGDMKNPVVKGDIGATYMGADTCKMCHLGKYEDWKTSGHPYKLMTPEEAKAIRPNIPLPEGYTWDEIQYVIGGWGWKSRYIGKDGFVITKTKDGQPIDKNQYNWQDSSWSAYHSGEDKKYDCQKCHNTGAAYEEGTHQDGLEGIEGTWEFRGVQCEACHGPGSEHVAQGGGVGVAIVKNDSSAFCGQCHIRGDPSAIPASGGFIRHHEQYSELLAAGGMSDLKCVTCHDPHKGVHKGATNPEGAVNGIKVGCESCHSAQATEFAGSTMGKAGVQCTDCHMPKATKSAIKLSDYEADVKTHLFRINTDPTAVMFSEDGKSANSYLTVEFTCLKCHTDKNKEWALKNTAGVHALAVESTQELTKEPKPETTPEPVQEPKKGICGPTAVLIISMMPVAWINFRRRR